MTLSETVGEEIISVAICGGSFHSLPGLEAHYLYLTCVTDVGFLIRSS